MVVAFDRAGLTIRGPHANVRRGPFLIARIFSGEVLLWQCTFFPEKVDDLLVVH